VPCLAFERPASHQWDFPKIVRTQFAGQPRIEAWKARKWAKCRLSKSARLRLQEMS
jgi:hypothetical protein